MINYQGPARLHPEYAQIRAIFRSRGVSHLFHFTSIENLASILSTGCLYCTWQLRHLGIFDAVQTGGNQLSLSLDKSKGNDRYVALSYWPKRPMAYYGEQEKHLCYMVVNPSIALGRGVVFTDINATANGVQKDQGLAGIQKVDFAAAMSMAPSNDSAQKARKQAEVLIPGTVPIEAIEYIAFRNSASLEEAERICGHLGHPPFQVKPAFFNNMFGVQTTVLCDYPMVVNQLNVEYATLRPSQNAFPRTTPIGVTMFSLVKAVPGLLARHEWRNPSNNLTRSFTDSFLQSDTYWVWDTLPSSQLARGIWHVSLYLNLQTRQIDVRQFTLPFTVT